jgi:hypothetical protein
VLRAQILRGFFQEKQRLEEGDSGVAHSTKSQFGLSIDASGNNEPLRYFIFEVLADLLT